jgi:toxin YoeB
MNQLCAEEDGMDEDARALRSGPRVVFTRTAWEQYLSHSDRRLVRRINDLIADIVRNGHEGLGKPEPLRAEFSGFWSRRIDQEHRLVYRVRGSDVEIVACRYHYRA